MPKELIYSAPALQPGQTSSYVVEHLAVGWQRNRHVQIGVVHGPPAELTINGERADPGLFMDLDRGQINRLIHTLRRARDQAYGPDA